MSHVMSPGKTTICLKAIFTQQNSSINFVSCPFRDLLVTCPLTFLLKKHEDDRERVCGVHCVPLREESPALRAAPSVRIGGDPQDEKMPQDEMMSKSLEMGGSQKVIFSCYVRFKMQFKGHK